MLIPTPLSMLYKSRVTWLIVAASLLWGCYAIIKPTHPELNSGQRGAIHELTNQVSAWLATIEIPRKKAIFLTFERDTFSEVSDPLRHIIWQSDRFDLADYSFLEKFRRAILWTHPIPADKESALKTALQRQCDYVIWGRVNTFSDMGSKVKLDVQLMLLDTATGAALQSKAFSPDSTLNIAGLALPLTTGGTIAWNTSLPSRIFYWIIFSLLLPVVTFPVAKKLTATDSNGIILLTLGCYTLLSVTVAWLLLAWKNDSAAVGLVMLFTFPIALIYYWRVLEKIKERTV